MAKDDDKQPKAGAGTEEKQPVNDAAKTAGNGTNQAPEKQKEPEAKPKDPPPIIDKQPKAGADKEAEVLVAEGSTEAELEAQKIAQAEQDLHEQRVKKYGEGYVMAEKPAGIGGKPMQKIFSAHAWKNLGPGAKDGSKEGYKVKVKMPPEVANLKKK